MAYTKNTWNDGDVITKEKMNNLESGVETANSGIPRAATTSRPASSPPRRSPSRATCTAGRCPSHGFPSDSTVRGASTSA